MGRAKESCRISRGCGGRRGASRSRRLRYKHEAPRHSRAEPRVELSSLCPHAFHHIEGKVCRPRILPCDCAFPLVAPIPKPVVAMRALRASLSATIDPFQLAPIAAIRIAVEPQYLSDKVRVVVLEQHVYPSRFALFEFGDELVQVVAVAAQLTKRHAVVFRTLPLVHADVRALDTMVCVGACIVFANHSARIGAARA